jgi:hypothetical protein
VLVKQNPARNISSFGEDGDGEIYALALSDGKIYQLVATPADGSK